MFLHQIVQHLNVLRRITSKGNSRLGIFRSIFESELDTERDEKHQLDWKELASCSWGVFHRCPSWNILYTEGCKTIYKIST